MKTVRQIAKEIGVSKQAVFQKMKREPLSSNLRGLASTVDGRLMVSVDGENLIKSAFMPNEPSTNHQPVDGVVDGLLDAPSSEIDGLISVLQATIDTLQGQLDVKDQQIEQQSQTITRLTDALAAAQQTAASAQALHAGTMHQRLLSGEAGADQQVQKPVLGRKRSWISRFFGS